MRLMILAVLTATLAVVTFPVGAGEKNTLGLREGEKIIIYDRDHRRIGTIENRGYGVLQFRDNQNHEKLIHRCRTGNVVRVAGDFLRAFDLDSMHCLVQYN